MKLDELALEIINFLQKWGMWKDTIILTSGNMYSQVDEKKSTYSGIPFVNFERNVDPEEYTVGLCRDGNWRSLANAEHIFDMVFEGPLQMLLSYDEYAVCKSDISEAAWEYIFSHTDVLSDYMRDRYDIVNEQELLNRIIENKFENPNFSAWDPLVFDSWEEYQDFCDGEEEELTPIYMRYDTYEDYLKDLESYMTISVEEILPQWEKLLETAKREFLIEHSDADKEIVSFPEIVDYVKNEFAEIFSRYGLRFKIDFSWSLSCYRII